MNSVSLLIRIGLCSAALLFAASHFAASPKDAEKTPHQLPPHAVKSTALNSYAFDLVVSVNKSTNRIHKLTITDVRHGSDAARSGIEAGDEIIRINGRAVTDFAVPTGPESDLHRIFLNRPRGEFLELEIITHRVRKVGLTSVGVDLF